GIASVLWMERIGLSDAYGSWWMYCTARRYSRRALRDIVARSTPSNRTEPEVGGASPAASRAAVVLPLPDSPTRHTTSPASRLSDTSDTAGRSTPLTRNTCEALSSSSSAGASDAGVGPASLLGTGDHLPFVVDLVVVDAGGRMGEVLRPLGECDQLRLCPAALRGRQLTPGREGAARRQAGQRWWGARDGGQLGEVTDDRRHRIDQLGGVGVFRVVEDVVRGAGLDHRAGVHRDHPVSELR